MWWKDNNVSYALAWHTIKRPYIVDYMFLSSLYQNEIKATSKGQYQVNIVFVILKKLYIITIIYRYM